MTAESFTIPGDEVTPALQFDAGTRTFRLRGRSSMEKPQVFYRKAQVTIAETLGEMDGSGPVTLRFEYSYIKTGSASAVRDMLLGVAKAGKARGAAVSLVWVQGSHRQDIQNTAELIESVIPDIREKANMDEEELVFERVG